MRPQTTTGPSLSKTALAVSRATGRGTAGIYQGIGSTKMTGKIAAGLSQTSIFPAREREQDQVVTDPY